jgi:biotin operon repressor
MIARRKSRNLGPLLAWSHLDNIFCLEKDGHMQDLAIVRSAAAAKCLVDPLRRTLLAAVRQPQSATAVARQLGMPRQVVNYHVRALEKSGLVVHVQDARAGNCVERIVQAVAREFIIAPSLYSRSRAEEISEDRFSAIYGIASLLQSVDDLALGLEAATARNAKLHTFGMEAEVHLDSAAEHQRFAEEVGEVLDRIARKYRHGRGRAFRLKFQAYPRDH